MADAGIAIDVSRQTMDMRGGLADAPGDASKPLPDARGAVDAVRDTPAKSQAEAGLPLDADKRAANPDNRLADSGTAEATTPLQGDARNSTSEDAPIKWPLDGDLSLDTAPVTNTCDRPSDCQVAGACPADAVNGCTCVTVPQQGRACLARCRVSKDCPKSSGAVLACSAAGLCIPASQITLDAGAVKLPSDAGLSTDAVDAQDDL